eukprot:361076_1
MNENPKASCSLIAANADSVDADINQIDDTYSKSPYPQNNNVFVANLNNKSTVINTNNQVSTKNASTFGGIICVTICIASWVAMSELIPKLSSNYRKAYFLRYCVGSTYSISLLPWLLFNYKNIQCSFNNISPNMIRSAFILSLVYNLPAYSWYLSLNATIAALNNTIFQSCIALAYIFSILLLKDYKMQWIKNIAVILCLSGVALIAFGTDGDSDKTETNTWYGILECVIATISFAFLEVILKIYGDKYFINTNKKVKYTKFDRVSDMLFMQGMIGILCILTIWPGIFVLDLAKIEIFELPKNNNDIICIVVTAILDTTYATALIAGIAFTNPVFFAVTQLLVVPITFLCDVFFNGFEITFMAIAGTFFIVTGFIFMEVPIKKYIKHCIKTKETIDVENKQYLINI